jgi:hypothetical protein
VSAAIREWRDRSFVEQTARLQQHWLTNPSWIEGDAREDINVWGAEWIPFRRKLLVVLSDLADDTWYTVGDLAGWVAARDPEMLGATFTVATARPTESNNGDTGRRRAAIAEVVTVTLETAVRWFGLVTIAASGRRDRLLTLTTRGRAISTGQTPKPTLSFDSGGGVVVSPSGEIALRQPTPLRIWSLSAFADLVALDRVATYQLTEASVGRALRAGFETRQIATFLTTQSGSALPDEIEQHLHAWSQGFRRVRLHQAVLITPDDPAGLDDLRATLTARGFSVQALDNALLIVGPASANPDDTGALAVQTALREAGFTPQWGPRTYQARRND